MTGALVIGVVMVLGFGSGIGLTSGASTSSAGTPSAAPTGRNLGTVVQPLPAAGSAEAGGLSSSASSSSASGGSDGSPSGNSASAVPMSMGGASASPAPAAATGGGAGTATTIGPKIDGCVPALSAMLQPLVTHVEKGHLEEPLPQQVGDILDLGQYVSTHLALLAQVVTPLFTTVFTALTGLPPLVNHVEKGHLEEPLPQQVGDILNVGQYVTTHTVVVGQVVAPALGALTC